MKTKLSQLILVLMLVCLGIQCKKTDDHNDTSMMPAEAEYIEKITREANHILDSVRKEDPEFNFLVDSALQRKTVPTTSTANSTIPECDCSILYLPKSKSKPPLTHEISQAHVHQEGISITKKGFASSLQEGELVITSGAEHKPKCRMPFFRKVNVTHPRLRKCNHIADMVPVPMEVNGVIKCVAFLVTKQFLQPSHRGHSHVCP